MYVGVCVCVCARVCVCVRACVCVCVVCVCGLYVCTSLLFISLPRSLDDRHQLTNDQPHVRNFMMDKVLITIYDGDISNSETHSDIHSDDFTDEDSNNSATAPLLSL